jgi:hypothetical protein
VTTMYQGSLPRFSCSISNLGTTYAAAWLAGLAQTSLTAAAAAAAAAAGKVLLAGCCGAG